MRVLRQLPPLAHVALIAGFGLALDRAPDPPSAFVLARLDATDAAPLVLGDRLAALSGPRDYGDQIEDIAGRPLFLQGRGKAAVKAAPPPERAPALTPEAPEQIFVRGTMVDAGGGQALVGLIDGENEVWVGPGEDIGGWRVEEILAGGIRLSREGADYTIRLFE